MLLALGITIYWLGAAVDWYTTKRMLVDLRGYREANPALAWLMRYAGVRTVLTITKVILFVVLFAMSAPWIIYLTLGLAMLGAGAWNYRLLKKNG